MILSSADILRILSGDAIVREEAELKIVEGRPGIGVGDKVYVYIDKYPTIDEFEATWNIWIQDNSGMGSYVLNAMTVLLPSFDFNGKHHTTTDFASDRTVVKTQEEIDREEFKAERVDFENRFSGIQKGVEERLSAVRDGVDGRDGKDGKDGLPGRDGRDGRDGKDLDATEVDLFDLADVERGIPIDKGQVLTWNGQEWTNLFVPQVWSVSGGGRSGDNGDGGGSSTLAGLLDTDTSGAEDGEILVYRSATGNWTAEPTTATAGVTQIIAGDNITIDPAGGTGAVTITSTGGGSGDVEEAPQDGNYYVRQNGAWINLADALTALDNRTIDGGDFTNGTSAGDTEIVDGGNFS